MTSLLFQSSFLFYFFSQQILSGVILEILAEDFGECFTPEVQTSWTKLMAALYWHITGAYTEVGWVKLSSSAVWAGLEHLSPLHMNISCEPSVWQAKRLNYEKKKEKKYNRKEVRLKSKMFIIIGVLLFHIILCILFLVYIIPTSKMLSMMWGVMFLCLLGIVSCVSMYIKKQITIEHNTIHYNIAPESHYLLKPNYNV